VIEIKRVFLIVLDSLGIGELPDASLYSDSGSNTLRSLYESGGLKVPNLRKMGLFNIEGNNYSKKTMSPTASFGRLKELSLGKDTTVGHWEMAGIISRTPFPTYPVGFPKEIITEFEKQTGRKVLCNRPYSGTEVIKDYGEEHIKTGSLIIYTSSDSVFQIAAHEDVVPVKELYDYCLIARNILVGEHAVSRVIARPFIGEKGNYIRTSNRHDFSVNPPQPTMLNLLKNNGYDVISVGKINDIFVGQGITEAFSTYSNKNGMDITTKLADRNFNGLCFVNLVDFDSMYGHRNDTKGYTRALNSFDSFLGDFTKKLTRDDTLIITADHGCDPATPSTDHSREYTPLIVYGKKYFPKSLGTRESFSDIGKTVLRIFGIDNGFPGTSFYSELF